MSRVSLGPMRWAMQSWSRMRLLNAAGGLLSAQLQMDYLPGMCSAGFFTIRVRAPAPDAQLRPPHLLQAGMAIQRFWLTATRLGLAIQPTMAVLIFADYARKAIPFTSEARAQRWSAALATALRRAVDNSDNGLVFMGRIGVPLASPRRSRSARRILADLLVPQPARK
jgi:sulfur-carrier protein adenylyltransferase/sulfurtransferase